MSTSVLSTSVPQVARVLLVAHPSRQAELGGWLRVPAEGVAGEGVGYELHLATPEAVPFERSWDHSWDVVVLDGESVSDDQTRRGLLRRLGQRPREASILFVCSRLPGERELEDAAMWADDFIYSGWAQAERVRSRVQVVALAPWRRAAALRRRAEAAGDARLRVLPAPVPKPTDVQMTTTQARLASDAFNEGRRVAVLDLRERVNRACRGLLDEVLGGLDCPEAAKSIEAQYRGDISPVVAARFGGATAAVEAVWGTLRQLVREELAEIERTQVGGS